MRVTYSPIEIKEETLLDMIKSSSEIISQKNMKMQKNKKERKEIEIDRQETYANYLDIIQKHLQKKQRKDFFLQIDKKVKLISPFNIITENYQYCMKAIILIRVHDLFYFSFILKGQKQFKINIDKRFNKFYFSTKVQKL